MKDKLLLYSTNSYLSYYVSKNFYDNVFWVWCTDYFNPYCLGILDSTNPHSACPFKLYKKYKNAIKKKKITSRQIQRNKAGLLTGANAKYNSGVITEEIKTEIIEIIHNATYELFEPLIYIIPYSKVKEKVIRVPIREKKKNPLSIEFRIESLNRFEFDIITMEEKSVV